MNSSVKKESDQVMTTEAAAAFLAVSPALLIKWRLTGGGPRYAKLGRNVRYTKKNLEDFLRSSERTSTSDDGGRHDG
ncbi:MAG: helix-turn-helix domain-containing protein [Nitrospinota bacterium]|nr:helix-turn-helix domain-containing protein [Nitrospinota bacterium]